MTNSEINALYYSFYSSSYNLEPRSTELFFSNFDVGPYIPSFSSEYDGNVYINLQENVAAPYKTVFANIAHFFTNNSFVKVVIKGTDFYIGNKCILNEAKAPLLVCAKKVVDTRVSELVVYINPVVFLTKNVMNTHIIKQLIPYYSISEFYYQSGVFNKKVPKIIISEEIHNFVQRRNNLIDPTISYSELNEQLNQVLIDNIQDFYADEE